MTHAMTQGFFVGLMDDPIKPMWHPTLLSSQPPQKRKAKAVTFSRTNPMGFSCGCFFHIFLELQTTSSLWLAINWMIPNLYIGNGWKSPNIPLKTGCLEFHIFPLSR